MTDTIPDAEKSRPHGAVRLWAVVLFAALAVAALFWWVGAEPAWNGASQATADDLLTSQWADEHQCQQCHQTQVQDWQGSHHQRAMQLPSERTVRGDFDGGILHSDEETSEFFRKGDEFWVRTPGADGEMGEFRIAYTFGWEPLQQYLIALDDGRLQALGAAWDTEKERWFHLYDGQEVDATHPLHWSQSAQTANTQCVECHTTGFQLGYDPTNNEFNSQWQSLGVGCQACHGPAAAHVDWALSSASSAEDALKGFTKTLERNSEQVEVCANCHSRRSPLGQAKLGQSLEDRFRISLLSAELYEVDGKILDEVFEHASFVQSAMHQAGVACSDCHNPHSGQLRAAGNAVCTQCHNPAGRAIRADIFSAGLKAFDYNSPAHHHHQADSPGAQCRNCHMPGKFYMGNDLRHDHSFSSPNPVQALSLKHSDACLSCHADEAAEKVAASFQRWYPSHQPRDGGYALALHSARHGQEGAAESLLEQLAREDLPALRRAALLAELPQYPSLAARDLLLENLTHPEASVRRTAIEAASALLEERQLQEQLILLLNDPLRSVRFAAAEQLLMLAEDYGQTLPAALFAEYEQAQGEMLANAESHFNLARLYQWTAREELVEARLRRAIELNPAFSPASIALAQWLDGGLPGAGLTLLEERLALYPHDADLHHALGLGKIRAGKLTEGVQALEQANALAPDNDHYAYVLAVAWHDTGRPEPALELLRSQLNKHPANRALRLTLLAYLGKGAESERLWDELRQQNPNDPALLSKPSLGEG